MIHLACHAITSNAGPGHSHLVLSGDQTLKVDAVLRQASGRPATAAGSLISLAACGTDLATGGLDEALTLATAFLAAGAATVVGTRWRIPDGPSASMMFMFHHLMTSRGLSPRDALREAQLWMLAPDRKAPAEMPPFLARSAGWAAFAEPIVWAAATHQGQ
jgi:CHAT domain-containing protein